MPRFFAQISYKGTHYHGWQEQPKSISVQEVINHKLSDFLKNPAFKSTGCGRTDSGVHSSNFYLHFDHNDSIDIEKCLISVNAMLPHDIVLHDVFEVDEKAHARFDATSRTYNFHIHQTKNAFFNDRSLYVHYPLDLDTLNAAAQSLFDYINFASFCKGKSDNKTNDCTIMQAFWTQNSENNTLVFTIQANRFLRNMVRSIVGTMLLVGSGKISLQEFRAIIEAKDRNKSGKSVDGKGLYLVEVAYPYIEAKKVNSASYF